MGRHRYLKKKSVIGSKIENIVSQILDTLHIPYQRNARINQYSVDFLIGEKIIVECYGDYWHCNPTKYSPDYFNKVMRLYAEQRWSKDANRQHRLESWGYKFVILWESDIKTTPATIQDQLREQVI